MIRVMTYNILHGARIDTKVIDLDKTAETIRELGADIVGLNEVRGEGDDPGYTAQAEILAEKLGYYYFFAPAIFIHGKLPYGNALVSKYPILDAEIIGIPDPETREEKGYYETRCLLSAKIDIGDGKILQVFATHFGLMKDEQKNAVDTVVGQLKECGYPHVFMGDLNVTPDNEVLAPILDVMQDTEPNLGEQKLSFPTDAPRIKIDYVMVSKDIKIVGAEIPRAGLSDHLPLYADIEI